MLVLLAACNREVKNSQQEASGMSSDSITAAETAIPEKTEQADLYSGEYITGEYPKGYYQSLKVESTSANQYTVSFSASKVKGKEACRFQGNGSIINDTLKVPVEWNEKTVQMTLFLRNDTMVVFTENFDDRFALNYYCSGGASLTGNYPRTGK